MKLGEILTERSGFAGRFDVPAVIYKETEDGEQEIKVAVSGKVYAERDPYGTGDSPTSYEVDIDTIEDEAGNKYEEWDLSKHELSNVEDRAIWQVT